VSPLKQVNDGMPAWYAGAGCGAGRTDDAADTLRTMFASSTLKRLGTWLAMLAVVWGALAPTLAQAVVRSAPTPGDGWVEVCSVSGMVWVSLDSGEQRNMPHAPSADVQPCDWCSLHGGLAGVPPVAAKLPVLAALSDFPSAFYQAPVTPAVWRSALSRAPPAVV